MERPVAKKRPVFYDISNGCGENLMERYED